MKKSEFWDDDEIYESSSTNRDKLKYENNDYINDNEKYKLSLLNKNESKYKNKDYLKNKLICKKLFFSKCEYCLLTKIGPLDMLCRCNSVNKTSPFLKQCLYNQHKWFNIGTQRKKHWILMIYLNNNTNDITKVVTFHENTMVIQKVKNIIFAKFDIKELLFIKK